MTQDLIAIPSRQLGRAGLDRLPAANRAVIGLVCYTFARVGAVVGMKVDDYYQNGKRWWFRLHEKGGKRHEVPAHHNADAYIDAYIQSAGIGDQKKGPLFRSVDKHRKLTCNPMHRNDVLRMIKRRSAAAALPSSTCCHTPTRTAAASSWTR
jgi:integrase/recombinase XerD